MCTKLGALFLLWALIITSVCGSCPADRDHSNLHDEGKLHDDLLCAYKLDYRPVKDHKTSIQVNVMLALKYINFDSLEETFTVHSWVVMKWKDEFLTWTPSNYGDIKELQMESHEIWVPKMSLLNADASIYQPDGLYTTCLVANDGTVTCVPHIAYSGICKSSLRRWPYDVQNCTLNFASWMHTGEQINYTSDQEQAVVLHEYNDGPGWKLLNVAHERIVRLHGTRTYPKLTYTFVMKREAAGPAAIVVVPSVVVVLLTLTSLLLDVKDNVRLMLICFSLFGHFLFLTEIGNDIPKHSSDTPIILLFVRDSMIITLVAIFETLLLISLRKRTLPAPTWIVSVTRLVTSGPGKYVVFTEFDPNDLIEKNIMAEDATSTSKEERSRAASDWIQFANLLNSFIFIISVFLYLVLILVYIPRDD